MKQTFNEWLEAKGLSFDEVSKKGEDLVKNLNEYTAEKEAAIIEALDKKASTEDILTLKQELVDGTLAEVKAHKEALEAQGIKMKEMEDTLAGKIASKDENLSFDEQFTKAWNDKLPEIKELKGTGQWVSFKVVGDMTLAGNVTGQIPQAERVAGYNNTPSRLTVVQNMVSRGSISSNVIEWVYKAAEDGTVGGTIEAATKNQIDFDFILDSNPVIKRTGYIKSSTEMLNDISFARGAMMDELRRELDKDIENQVYQGTGAGTDLEGIVPIATAFAAGSFAATVDNANIVDVLRAAINQIRIAEQPDPTAILMHPSDLLSLKFLKVSASDDRYIQALQEISANGTLDGVPIVTTTLVTIDDYLVGAFDLARLLSKGEIEFQVGLDGNDLTKNMRTIIAEWRGVQYVANNDRGAFVTGTFTAGKAALETP